MNNYIKKSCHVIWRLEMAMIYSLSLNFLSWGSKRLLCFWGREQVTGHRTKLRHWSKEVTRGHVRRCQRQGHWDRVTGTAVPAHPWHWHTVPKTKNAQDWVLGCRGPEGKLQAVSRADTLTALCRRRDEPHTGPTLCHQHDPYLKGKFRV